MSNVKSLLNNERKNRSASKFEWDLVTDDEDKLWLTTRTLLSGYNFKTDITPDTAVSPEQRKFLVDNDILRQIQYGYSGTYSQQYGPCKWRETITDEISDYLNHDEAPDKFDKANIVLFSSVGIEYIIEGKVAKTIIKKITKK